MRDGCLRPRSYWRLRCRSAARGSVAVFRTERSSDIAGICLAAWGCPNGEPARRSEPAHHCRDGRRRGSRTPCECRLLPFPALALPHSGFSPSTRWPGERARAHVGPFKIMESVCRSIYLTARGEIFLKNFIFQRRVDGERGWSTGSAGVGAASRPKWVAGSAAARPPCATLACRMKRCCITKLLVANRGEIALRIIRSARLLGLAPVAVYSEADADAVHVAAADQARLIGPPEASQSYLNIAAILEAARATGADAIHPGYGFLSERPEFARAVDEAGIVFVGPPADVMAALGDKVAARRLAAGAGVAVVPGLEVVDQRGAQEFAARGGFPLIVQAAAGRAGP